MMARQIMVYHGIEMDRMFHSTALNAPMMAELMMYAIGQGIEDDEEGCEAGDGERKPHQTAFGKNPFAHAQYVERNRMDCNARSH